ncbi:MAG: anhydro-N-acetylmuramic acid kinase [Saprospiraceae bacterium]|jgi:anhydro-N-acetylmuramic acid kinase
MQYPVDVIGVMSGTSLDGVDLAYVRFADSNYEFELVKTVTVVFPSDLLLLLENSRLLSNDLLIELHNEWSGFVGDQINKHFISQGLNPDCIASHGHTVFHEPDKGFTLQIGSLSILSKVTECTVIGDFRMLDVSKGGEGAPLVPIGDQLLFPSNKVCLNLGGIANVSVKNGDTITAFDVCPCNLLLNSLASEKGLLFDMGGKMGKSGSFNKELFNKLNEVNHYKLSSKPSLGIEILEKEFYPILNESKLSTEDKIHTVCKHIAFKLQQNTPKGETILVSGGGAYNNFLIDCFKQKGLKVEMPSSDIIEFKEALIFAFLGLRKLENKINVLKSVTGATSDSVAGVVFKFTSR